MKALRDNGFQVPEPVAWNRHTIVMSLVDGVPLRAIEEIGDSASLYADLIGMIMDLAKVGLIHGDFNEFNVMVEERPAQDSHKTTKADTKLHRESEESQENDLISIIPWMIDFPQAISIDHVNADFYFNRDVQCIKDFFERKFHFKSSESGPTFQDAKNAVASNVKTKLSRLDIAVEAAGFSRSMAKDLEDFMQSSGQEDHSDCDAESSNDSIDNLGRVHVET